MATKPLLRPIGNERKSPEETSNSSGITGRAVDNVINTAIKIPKVFPLATLLDSHGGGNHIGASHQPNMDDNLLKKKRKKDEN